MVTLIEQPKLVLDCSKAYVAIVSVYSAKDTTPGPAETLDKYMAESDDFSELLNWADSIKGEYHGVSIFETWPIAESVAPKGRRLHGKRENKLLHQEQVRARSSSLNRTGF